MLRRSIFVELGTKSLRSKDRLVPWRKHVMNEQHALSSKATNVHCSPHGNFAIKQFRGYSLIAPSSAIGRNRILLMKYPMLSLHHNQSIRTYIFFENIFDKIFPSQEGMENMKRREKVIVALKSKRQRLLDSSSQTRAKFRQWRVSKQEQTRVRFKQWRLSKQDRIRLYRSSIESRSMKMMNRFRQRSNDARLKWKTRTTSEVQSIINKGRLRRELIKGRLNRLSSRYIRRVVTIEEPFKSEWFTDTGLPLTSRDPISQRFVNPWNSISTNGLKPFVEVWRWKKTRFFGFLDESLSNATKEQSSFVNERTKEDLKADALHPHKNQVNLTWIGHATTLVHFSDTFKVLTDPIFSNKASPIQWFQDKEFFGVPRWKQPSLTPDDLGEIDVVVISHDHYDHLDLGSVEQLHHENKVKFWAVPMGIKDWLKDVGIPDEDIVELEWWQSVMFKKGHDGNIKKHGLNDFARGGYSVKEFLSNERNEEDALVLTCAPTQHWCSRSPFDRNTRLWCSWAMHALVNESEKQTETTNDPLSYYFAGDTAYPESFPLHRLIGDNLGPFDIAAIPIGAYKPRFFMRDSHCNPEEALRIHKDIQSHQSVSIHWGTFPLANESFIEPPTLLDKAIHDLETSGEHFDTNFSSIPHGETIRSGRK